MTIAVVAGGAAFLLRGHEPAPAVVAVGAPAIELDEVLVAAHAIDIGQTITAADFRWQNWPVSAIAPEMLRKSAGAAIDEMQGAIARVAFLAGEPLRKDKVVKGPGAGFMAAMLPSGNRAIAINIDSNGATSAGGFILPNDRVDVLVTEKLDDGGGSRSNEKMQTSTLLENVRVLAVGQNVQEKNGEKVVTGTNATLEVTPEQAERVANAQRNGQLSLTLRSLLDFKQATASEDTSEVARSRAIVRFGVTTTVAR